MATSVPNGNAGALSAERAMQFAAYEAQNTAQPWQRVTRSGATDINSVVNTNNFPSRYIPKDPNDDYVKIKSMAIQEMYNTGNNAARVHTQLTDRDIMYLENKLKTEEYAKFRAWTEQWFDFTDPAQVDIYTKAFPDYFQRRAELIKNLGEIQIKYAILRMMGPRTEQDFMFLWGIESGRIPLVRGFLAEPKDWASSGPAKKLAWFNPWRLTTRGIYMPNEKNRTDPGARRATNPFYVGFSDSGSLNRNYGGGITGRGMLQQHWDPIVAGDVVQGDVQFAGQAGQVQIQGFQQPNQQNRPAAQPAQNIAYRADDPRNRLPFLAEGQNNIL